MKSLGLLLVLANLIALPSLSLADIYKWKDKDGVTRYSDTPPPSNTKLEKMGTKKVIKLTDKEPLSVVTDSKTPSTNPQPLPTQQLPLVNADDAAAKLRQQNAEIEKKNKLEKEAQLKLKLEKCKAAKANLASYEQGGRIYKMSEKGEREYLDDAALKRGVDQSRIEVNQFCN